MVVSVLSALILSISPNALRSVPPVSGPIIQHFVAPSCQRCAGHRGVTIATRLGQQVVAALPGKVSFVGEVGGLTYVVQVVRPGVKVTYGWLTPLGQVAEGDEIVAGALVGWAGERTYLGVRVEGQYVEPLRYLGLGGSRLRGGGGVVVGRTGSAR
jgi:murein DD-endopeptidase MepM/ murein hydrolase activator NlpD